ncbi:MAG: hypothetical protein HQ581_00285, partial [Planctomycetes bacterium]|nr:hypothetical protein [Planctomycetota bacterium]
ALLEDLSRSADGVDFAVEKQALDQLRRQVQAVPISDSAVRKTLYQEACVLRRRISFKNPLLNFDKILFVKREINGRTWPEGTHMCDQYFGFHAKPGGGLFVLEGAFSDAPQLRDLTGNNACTDGRLQGKVLQGGFLAPELSFDAREILFCFTEAHRIYPNWPAGWEPHWSPESTFHVFKMHVDGSDLSQLTDGPVNDLHPCFLPNGRVALISERRGGFGRCHGRPVPCFTLHSMRADGTDITMLSPHETNEWNPSVDNHGMIVFTRWDYVDRGFSQAHHPWSCYPDGRDPRAIHGNWSLRMGSRPHMEQHVRAIPGSGKLVATACGHHTQVYGSLVLIDPRRKDDGRMSMIRRLTPEQWFPESEYGIYQGEGMFCTAWPLSEDYYLCAYYGGANDGQRQTTHDHYNYGVYLIDSWGNRELLYRDANISCHKPIPLRPRTRPPVIPHGTLVGRPDRDDTARSELPRTATAAVMNVYNGSLPFPEGTRIERLQIVQLLPKTTPVANVPRIGHGDQKGARRVLGTVPVEADGSAYFELPVGVPVYFQAIDQQGTAVQSMRSATWVAPGEKLVCKGCHEPRETTTDASRSYAMALQRKASEIAPEVSGSNPLSFPLLVQPVLDRKCAGCHTERIARGEKCVDLSSRGIGPGGSGWYTSYNNLRPFAFFWDNAVFDAQPRTTPGKFGARASKLHALLEAGHYDTKLTTDEKHRIDLWLDCNSDFYGSYENLREQEAGQRVESTLE